MQLVYIYGPPGVGKLTVAREVAALTGFRLFHNHLAVNLAASVLEYQSEPYYRLLRQIWRDIFTEAAREDVDVICTAMYRAGPERDASIKWMLEPVYMAGGTVAYVQLTCTRDEWLRRLQDDSRRALNKLTDVHRALALAEEVDLFARVPFEPGLTLDTTVATPEAVARQIVEYCSMTLG